MPILLKIRWTFKEGRRDDFEKFQKELMTIMLDHKGVMTYHADYPAGENYSEWTEIYCNNDSFRAHLANEKGKAPLGVCIDASAKIECSCWGDPDDASKEILAGFGAVYMESGENSFVVNPRADKDATA
jgi:quinol monooxygenase YgiN